MSSGDEMRNILALDRVIHEPARLLILIIFASKKSVGFPELLAATHLSNGNLHNHLRKLEQAGYIEARTGYRGKRAVTIWQLSEVGQAAFEIYQTGMRKVCRYLEEHSDP